MGDQRKQNFRSAISEGKLKKYELCTTWLAMKDSLGGSKLTKNLKNSPITKIVVASLANVTWERRVMDRLWTDQKLLKHQYCKHDAWITKDD